MNMQDTPKSLRLHIGLFGRRNVGKSSLINALTGRDVSIVSARRAPPPTRWRRRSRWRRSGRWCSSIPPASTMSATLGALRRQRTGAMLERVDVALLVCDRTGFGADEEAACRRRCASARRRSLCVFNKMRPRHAAARPNSTALGARPRLVEPVSAAAGRNIDGLREAITRLVPDDRVRGAARWSATWCPPGELAVLVVPIDLGAPKGRLILPQVQVIREILDSDAMCMVVKERELRDALATAWTASRRW